MPTFPSTQIGNASQSGSLGSAETDLIIFNDPKKLEKSIMSFFFAVSMGGNTQIAIRYYAAYVYRPLTTSYVAGDWFQLPSKTLSSTVSSVADGYLKVVSTLSFVDSLSTSDGNTNPVQPAMAALKITTQVGGAFSAVISVVGMVRDN